MALNIADTILLLASTPAPSPSPTLNETSVTPGPMGFAVTFVIAAIGVLLVLDMNRRIRRTRYRSEVRERIEAERAEGGDGNQNAEARPDDESDRRV